MMSCITLPPVCEPPSGVTSVVEPDHGERGRRPGNRDTRAEIIAAAAAAFVEGGFEGTSLRAVAGRAGVDPALVHHYFPGGKPELFNVVMETGSDPRLILDLVLTDDHTQRVAGDARQQGRGHRRAVHPHVGRRLVRFRRRLRLVHPGGRVVARGRSRRPGVFLAERIWAKLGDEGRPTDELAQRRA